mmetsp:Transcript_85083/g.226960  ORF Transcript_85083/g.226960 Transcript_85083/m.226960 type:complete len:142 (+) Transcript_85083:1340-1765(+)
MEEVRKAAAEANAGFVEALPKGYETEVGERGTQLSGGQKQRIAIARAVLKDAPLLILDEAYSAQDEESARLVHEALSRLMQKRTTLMVAHRPSSLAAAGRVVVLDQGRVVEQGRCDDLLRSGGALTSLAATDFDGPRTPVP